MLWAVPSSAPASAACSIPRVRARSGVVVLSGGPGIGKTIEALPAPQARALHGALALGPPASGDRFAVHRRR